MRRFALLLTIFFLAPLLHAQNLTTVQATVTDSAGTAYTFGTYTVSLVNTSTQPAQFGGNTTFQKTFQGGLDTNGFFSLSLPSVSVMTPASVLQWSFFVCANPQAIAFQFPKPTLPCFTYTSTGTQVSGASVDLSASMTAVAAVIPKSITNTGNIGFTGNNTSGNFNAQFFVDGVKYSGCQAAMTAATTYANGTSVTVPGTGPLVECPAAGNAENIVTVNYDVTRDQCNSVTTNPPCSGMNWQYDDSNVFHMLRMDFTTAHQDNAGVSVALRPITTLKNATANNLSGIDGVAAEADTAGTLSGAFSNLQAAEHQITVGSTGGSFQAAQAVLGAVNTSTGSTTTITTARGLWGIGCKSIAAANKPVNCYGADFSDQLGNGTTRNYSFFSRAPGLLGYSGNQGRGGLDAEDHLNATHQFLSFDISDNTILTAISSSGILLQDSTPANQVKIDNSGMRVFKAFRYTETTAPAAAAGVEVCYGDSSVHALLCNYNNATNYGIAPLFGGSYTFATGNLTTTFNSAMTTDAQDAITFGETSAATNGTLTNGLANQAEVNIATATNSTAAPLEVAQGSITNTVATPIAQFESTWNNASLVGQGIIENVTNTASGASSLLENLRVGNVTQWSVDKGGLATGAIVQTTTGTQTISGADYTNSTTTPSTVFNWSLPATAAAKNYRYTCDIMWESTNTTLVGPVFGVNISAAPTQLTAAAAVQNTLAGADVNGYLSNATTGSQTLVTSAAAGVTSTNYWAKIWGTIEGAPTAGSTFIINAASTSGTTATLNIRRGSGCTLN